MNITQQEFSDLTGNKNFTQDMIDQAKIKAQLQVEAVTNGFYTKYDINSDLNSDVFAYNQRAQAYKQAIALTIEFMISNEITSTADLHLNGQSNLQIGDMRVQGSALNSANLSNFAVPDEALTLLGRHGLLYQGGY